MSELHFPGNCLRGSRPLLSFDAAFDAAPHLRLIKELLLHVFGVPRGARKSKPFVDHVLGFTVADGKLWVRVFQIGEAEVGKTDTVAGAAAEDDDDKKDKKKRDKRPAHTDETKLSLTEIGPRFVLTPIVILEGSFGGPVIYENREFVSPNAVRSEARRRKAGRYNARSESGVERKAKRGDLGLRTGVEGGRREGREAERELENGVLFA